MNYVYLRGFCVLNRCSTRKIICLNCIGICISVQQRRVSVRKAEHLFVVTLTLSICVLSDELVW